MDFFIDLLLLMVFGAIQFASILEVDEGANILGKTRIVLFFVYLENIYS
jgi:hypothetical protein